jgi:hypothetical protein
MAKQPAVQLGPIRVNCHARQLGDFVAMTLFHIGLMKFQLSRLRSYELRSYDLLAT